VAQIYGPLHDSYVARVEKGMRPTMARLTLARKIATITLTTWKKESGFRPQTFAAASSLSISGEEGFPSLGILSRGGRSGSGDAPFEDEYQSMRSGGFENPHIR
jgi:hypothetical protein